MSGQLTGSYLFFYAEKNRKTEQIRMNTELLKAKYFLQKGLKKKRKLSQTFHVKNSAPCQSSSRDGHTQCILVSPKSNRVASTQQHHVTIFLNEKNAKL